MQIYLPIAEVSVNAFLLLGLGGLVGILSGMFGVGGGFLMTPLLFFIGIPPAVAVATEANQIVASSFSGVLAHLKRRTVDVNVIGAFLFPTGEVFSAVTIATVVGVGVWLGQYVAVGEPRGGYIFLPPWRLWQAWAREALTQALETVDAPLWVWINGEHFVAGQVLV